MAGLGYEPPVCVAGDVFCVPYEIDLVVRKKIKGLSEARYEVFDIHGRLLLQVHGGLWSLQRKRVMRDAAGFPILSIHEKVKQYFVFLHVIYNTIVIMIC